VTNITHNPGIIPVDLGLAKIISGSHTFVHHFKLNELHHEIGELNKQYAIITNYVKCNLSYVKDLENHFKIINILRETIDNKMKHFNFHSKNKRKKRGLVNPIGKFVKAITGNLDNDDGKRYNRILKQLTKDNMSLKIAMNSQYTINKQLVDNFNKTISTLKFNNNEIILKLKELSEAINKEESHQHIKDILQQIEVIYNLILNVAQDIENSLTFCKLKTMHPSIVKSNELMGELEKVSHLYKDKLPIEIKRENIAQLERLIEVDCHIEDNEIIYFLRLPIYEAKYYRLYHLLSVPTQLKDAYSTIVLRFQYLLKYKNEVKLLKGNCVRQHIYQCSKDLLSVNNSTCESDIMLNGYSSHCEHLKLNISQNLLELIPELGSYLAVFIKPDDIQIINQDHQESRRMQGILLLKKEDSQLFYKGKELIASTSSVGKPLVVSGWTVNSNISSKGIKFITNLRDLKLNDIKLQPVTITKTNQSGSLVEDPPVILLVIIICIILFLCVSSVQNMFQNRFQE